MKILIIAPFAFSLLLLGCGKHPAKDVHQQPRTSKAYESIDLASLDIDALIRHIAMLSNEVSVAVQTKAFGEMHHLEMAITAALGELENQLDPVRLAKVSEPIETMKSVARKLHQAGHDQNLSIAQKVDEKLADLSRTLLSLIP